MSLGELDIEPIRMRIVPLLDSPGGGPQQRRRVIENGLTPRAENPVGGRSRHSSDDLGGLARILIFEPGPAGIGLGGGPPGPDSSPDDGKSKAKAKPADEPREPRTLADDSSQGHSSIHVLVELFGNRGG
jgi:hypothetical protein